MSTTSHILVAEHRAVYRGLPVLMFWVFIVSLLLVATAFGGMQYFVIALAFGLGVIVWMHSRKQSGLEHCICSLATWYFQQRRGLIPWRKAPGKCTTGLLGC